MTQRYQYTYSRQLSTKRCLLLKIATPSKAWQAYCRCVHANAFPHVERTREEERGYELGGGGGGVGVRVGTYPAPSSTPSLSESAQACSARPHGLRPAWANQMKGQNPFTKGKKESLHERKEPSHERKESFHERKESSQLIRHRHRLHPMGAGRTSYVSKIEQSRKLSHESKSLRESVRVRVSHEPRV